MFWEAVANWAVAVATILLAAVAVWQERIRAWWDRPKLEVTTATSPPDCVMAQIDDLGEESAFAVYLRVRVTNSGNTAARNVEVYATALQHRRYEGGWEPIDDFPAMDLKWANTDGWYYMPRLLPKMSKHCDVCHIVDPAHRVRLREESKVLKLTNQKCSMTFDQQIPPDRRAHIVGPGEYVLTILVAAENCPPSQHTIKIKLAGPWDADPKKMFGEHVAISMERAAVSL
jgi:hypothetical protein